MRTILRALCFSVVLLAADPTPAQEPQPTGAQVAAALEEVMVQAIAACEKSVVAIARVRKEEAPASETATEGQTPQDELRLPLAAYDPTHPDFIPHEFGSGVVIDRRGLILTQYHLLGEHDTHWVTTTERKVYAARIRAADPRSGLAVLAVDADDLVPMRLGDASQLRKGQIVMALGNPYAIARDGEASASWGIVANLARKAAPLFDHLPSGDKPALHHFGTLIQTDARLNLGTSGGALVNLRGEMVGLTTSIAAIAGYEQPAGYAVPMNDMFRRIIEILKDGREVEYGLLGVRSENLPRGEREPGQPGIMAGEIIDGTPAQQAGLKASDVITHVNDQPIPDADSLVLELGKHFAGTPVELTVERGRRVLRMKVRLSKYPVSGRRIVTQPRPAWRGLHIDYATAVPAAESELADGPGHVDTRGCVAIIEVDRESPAWREGLRPRMFVTHVDGRRVATPDEFLEAVTDKDGPVRLRLTLPENQNPERTISPGA